MANIRIPQARLSTPATAPRPIDNSDLILKVMGQNPYAQAIDQITPVLAQALQKRALLRQQANAISQMASAAGEEPPTDTTGLTPQTYGDLLSIKTGRAKVANEQAFQGREESRKNNDQLLKFLELQKGTKMISPTGGTTEIPGMTGVTASQGPGGLLSIDTSQFKPGNKAMAAPMSPLIPKNPLQDMQDQLDPKSPKSGMGKLAERSGAADRVLTLLDQANGDPNVLQSPEAAASVAALVQGGQSGRVPMEQLQHLTPSSLKGDVMKQISYVMNSPSNLGQQEFFKSLRDTAVREQGTIEKQIKDTQKSRLGAFEPTHRLFPDSYNSILQNYGLDPTKVKNGRYIEDQMQAAPAPASGPATHRWNPQTGKVEAFQ